MQMEQEGRLANWQACISVIAAASLTYFIIHLCYINSYSAVLLISSCTAISAVLVLGLTIFLAVIAGWVRIDDRSFYYWTYWPLLIGMTLGFLLACVLLCIGYFTQWEQPTWLFVTITVFSGPLIAFTSFIVCEIFFRKSVAVFEMVTDVQIYKLSVNSKSVSDVGAMVFYAFPTFLLWSSFAGLAIGGIALL